MTISWASPDSKGSQITGYLVYIQKHDGTFALETTSCDGQLQSVIDALSCTIPVNTLKVSPFMLPWGSQILTKVVAQNIYGKSAESQIGSGVFITTKPDPATLNEDLSQRTSNTIGLSWIDASENGGTDILDYKLSYDQSIGVFDVLDDTITSNSYVVSGLLTGSTYLFKL